MIGNLIAIALFILACVALMGAMFWKSVTAPMLAQLHYQRLETKQVKLETIREKRRLAEAQNAQQRSQGPVS